MVNGRWWLYSSSTSLTLPRIFNVGARGDQSPTQPRGRDMASLLYCVLAGSWILRLFRSRPFSCVAEGTKLPRRGIILPVGDTLARTDVDRRTLALPSTPRRQRLRQGLLKTLPTQCALP